MSKRKQTRKLKGYAGQERRLMSVLRLQVATPDIVLDELNQMKKEREADEKRLASLTQTKENVDKMVDMEANLKELCARIVPDIDSCNNDVRVAEWERVSKYSTQKMLAGFSYY